MEIKIYRAKASLSARVSKASDSRTDALAAPMLGQLAIMASLITQTNHACNRYVGLMAGADEP